MYQKSLNPKAHNGNFDEIKRQSYKQTSVVFGLGRCEFLLASPKPDIYISQQNYKENGNIFHYFMILSIFIYKDTDAKLGGWKKPQPYVCVHQTKVTKSNFNHFEIIFHIY